MIQHSFEADKVEMIENYLEKVQISTKATYFMVLGLFDFNASVYFISNGDFDIIEII